MPIHGRNHRRAGACNRQEACAYGLACKSQRCVALPDTGESCVPWFGVSECRQLRDYCSTRTYRCEPRGGIGASCVEDYECAPLYTCSELQCVLRRSELGESCTYSSDCKTAGAICSSEGCMLPRGAGEQCGYYTECESNICNYETDTCVSLDGCL